MLNLGITLEFPDTVWQMIASTLETLLQFCGHNFKEDDALSDLIKRYDGRMTVVSLFTLTSNEIADHLISADEDISICFTILQWKIMVFSLLAISEILKAEVNDAESTISPEERTKRLAQLYVINLVISEIEAELQKFE